AEKSGSSSRREPAGAGSVIDPSNVGIRAYHGSPHDFDRFSMDKIGTGEGAQAYGHGLYFAEAEDVARSYRDGLRLTSGTLTRDMQDAVAQAAPGLPESVRKQ